MNIIRCKNGHFYDADCFPSCPHCGSEEVQKKERNKPIGRLFSRKSKENPSDAVSGSPVSQQPVSQSRVSQTPVSRPSSVSFGTPPVVSKRPQEPPEPEFDPFANPRDPFPQFSQEPSAPEFDPFAGARSTVPPASGETNSVFGFISGKPASEPAAPPAPPVTAPNPASHSLLDAVNLATASSAEKTISVFQSMTDGQQPANGSPSTDPVVGWLVCIGGPHLGESFLLFSGRNAIGRSENNRIVLSRDRKVSRERQSVVIFEPKKKQFFLLPGEVNGFTYLNGDFVSGQQALNAKDVLEMGDSKLLFVPLCGDDFSWDQYITNG